MINSLLKVSIFKTLLFNLHYFGLKGLRIPVLVSKNVLFKCMRGGVILESFRTCNVKIGFEKTGILDPKYSRFIWFVEGEVALGDNVNISSGVKLSCAKNAKLTIGANSSININTEIICMDNINIGKNTLISWNVLVMDSDFHKIGNKESFNRVTKPIQIGEHVWICCRAILLKGSIIPNDCVVAANSIVTKKFEECECLISNNVVLKRNVLWEI